MADGAFYLRRNPDEARRYEARRREIAHLIATERQAYVSGKRELVEELLRQARRPLCD